MDAAGLLDSLTARGVRLAPLDNGRIRVTPPRSLTPTERQAIVHNRPAILALLARRLTIVAKAGVAVDPDRYCWPNGPAANTTEVAVLEGRLEVFRRDGLPAAEAERLADRLLLRDREDDDRIMCAECRHSRSQKCPGGAPLHGYLMRCHGFAPQTTLITGAIA